MSNEFKTVHHSHIFILVTTADRKRLLTLAFNNKNSAGIIITVPSLNFTEERRWENVDSVSRAFMRDKFGVDVNGGFDRLSRKLYETRDDEGNNVASEHIYIGYKNLSNDVFQIPYLLSCDSNFIGMNWRDRNEIERIFNGRVENYSLAVGIKEVSQIFMYQDTTGTLYPDKDQPREVDRRDIRSVHRLPEY